MSSKSKILLEVVSILLALLFVGHQTSDHKFYDDFLQKNKLTNSKEVFYWITKKYGNPHQSPVVAYLSPRYLIENRKVLWCDEGATIMATLNHYLGYKTRLVDLYGYDNISHHTVLQVFEGNRWVTYDYTFRLRDKPFNDCYKYYKYAVKEPRIKQYPKFYNTIVNSNSIAKYVIFKVRGIPEY